MDRNGRTEEGVSRQDIEERLHNEVKQAVEVFEQAKKKFEKLQGGVPARDPALNSAEAEYARTRQQLEQALATLLGYIADAERREQHH